MPPKAMLSNFKVAINVITHESGMVFRAINLIRIINSTNMNRSFGFFGLNAIIKGQKI